MFSRLLQLIKRWIFGDQPEKSPLRISDGDFEVYIRNGVIRDRGKFQFDSPTSLRITVAGIGELSVKSIYRVRNILEIDIETYDGNLYTYHVIRNNIMSIEVSPIGLNMLKNPTPDPEFALSAKKHTFYEPVKQPEADSKHFKLSLGKAALYTPDKNAIDLDGIYYENAPATKVPITQHATSLRVREAEKIRGFVERRKIRWLCHFTRKENLESIKKHGLLTIDSLNYRGLSRYVTDTHRMDKHKTLLCLSISKPNMPMLVSKAKKHEYCLLLIDASILYSKKCLFYKSNAAMQVKNFNDDTQNIGYKALAAMFNKQTQVYSTSSNCTIRCDRKLRHPCEPTLEQAEVQCFDDIEPVYILHIIEDLSFLYRAWEQHEICSSNAKPFYLYLEEYIDGKR